MAICSPTPRPRRRLFTDDLIAADKQLDVMGGSAGAILGLLRLHRDTRSADVLDRAVKCGEHLLAQRRVGAGWPPQLDRTRGPRRHRTRQTGSTACRMAPPALPMRFRRWRRRPAATTSPMPRRNALRLKIQAMTPRATTGPICAAAATPAWPCQWCHGAPGIGLARVGMATHAAWRNRAAALLATDIRNAVVGVERAGPVAVDTLCCGTLGSIEFFCEAAGALDRGDLRELAARRLHDGAATGGSGGRLPLEQRQTAIQSRPVSRPCPGSATRCCGKPWRSMATLHCRTC